jgi:hypothetical protein
MANKRNKNNIVSPQKSDRWSSQNLNDFKKKYAPAIQIFIENHHHIYADHDLTKIAEIIRNPSKKLINEMETYLSDLYLEKNLEKKKEAVKSKINEYLNYELYKDAIKSDEIQLEVYAFLCVYLDSTNRVLLFFTEGKRINDWGGRRSRQKRTKRLQRKTKTVRRRTNVFRIRRKRV